MAGIHIAYKADTVAVKLGRKLSTAWKDLWKQLNRENLHFRIIRCAIATAVTVIIALLPGIRAIYGPAAYLGPLTSVLGKISWPPRQEAGRDDRSSGIGIDWDSCGNRLGHSWDIPRQFVLQI